MNHIWPRISIKSRMSYPFRSLIRSSISISFLIKHNLPLKVTISLFWLSIKCPTYSFPTLHEWQGEHFIYGHLRSTCCLPDSSYSCLEIHICWKLPREARMEPPIQDPYLHTIYKVITDIRFSSIKSLGRICCPWNCNVRSRKTNLSFSVQTPVV